MALKTKEIESKVCAIQDFSSPGFIYDLLLAYGKPKSSITRLKLKSAGTYNLSKDPDEIYWKDNVLFRYINTTSKDELLLAIDGLTHDKEKLKHNPKFVIVTNWDSLLAVNTRDYSSLDVPIKEISKHYSFFLAWAGMNKAAVKVENEADLKAAEKMASLYDEIIRRNIELAGEKEFIHNLNVFFSRLLFCFFAEDTNVFPKNLFTGTIEQHTQEDGSDLGEFLTDIFMVMDTKNEDRKSLASHLDAFPYVNGKLFAAHIPLPKFSTKARRLLVECGDLIWARINPDIFGSMIQAVAHPGERASAGMHYTSVLNIMKVIEPLFLNELYAEYEKHKDNRNKLWGLLARIYKIKVFDPACGSGNFLIIAYKELRKLEHLILGRINKLGLSNLQSQIKLENFYGIDIDDFAHEIAMVSLWLAKHQMNHEFDELFGTSLKLIPLSESGNIVAANSAIIDWREVCPTAKDEEIYLIGNPPYLGSSMQDEQQKEELARACNGFANYKNLDYIAIWFIKAAEYIGSKNIRAAFVSTNSICQGEQVALLWPHIFEKDVEIEFAHTSFKWSNNAKNNAGVTCVIIGLSKKSNRDKHLFNGAVSSKVSHINAYLAEGPEVIIPRRAKSIAGLPEMIYGNKPTDKGNFILSQPEKITLVQQYPEAARFIKKYMGSDELVKGGLRYCLWIEDGEVETARSIPEIARRLDAVADFRLSSKAGTTIEYARYPNRFKQRTYLQKECIIVPSITSERRLYLPVAYIDENVVVSNLAFAVYDAEPFIFGLLSSRLHMTWVRAAAGQLETRIRYSNSIVYNNFPAPGLSQTQKTAISDHVFEVLAARENHSEMTLAQMYDPAKMPRDLKHAHEGLDDIVERSYRGRPFESDQERLSYLLREYEKLAARHKEQK